MHSSHHTRGLQDLDPVRYARWVRAGITLALFGYGVVLVAGLAAGGKTLVGLISESTTVAVALVALLIARRGRASAGATLLILAVFIEVHTSLVEHGHMETSALIVFPALVVGAGFMMGGKAAFAVAVALSVTSPMAAWAGRSWLGAAAPQAAGDLYRVLTLAPVLLVTAALIYLGLRVLGDALEAARDRELRINHLVDHTPDGLLSLDGAARVVTANRAAERVLGCDRGDMVGRSIDECLLSDSAGDGSLGPRLLEGTNEKPLILRPASTTAQTFVEATSERSVDADGSVTVQVVLRDVTARMEADSLREQLQHAQRLEAVGRLAGGIAHDFNNLLTIVGGSAEVLLEGIPEDSRYLVEQILAAQERGASLTRRLLAYARRDVVQPVPVEVEVFLEDLEPLLARLAGEAVALSLRVEPGAHVLADRGQLEQVLLNLVSNARDAMPDGGPVRIEVETEPAADALGYVVLRVSDEGSGMDRRTLEQAMEPFFTTKPSDRGTGLGLSVVHGIVARSGGELSIESTPDQGTTVTVRWPASSAPEA